MYASVVSLCCTPNIILKVNYTGIKRKLCAREWYEESNSLQEYIKVAWDRLKVRDQKQGNEILNYYNSQGVRGQRTTWGCLSNANGEKPGTMWETMWRKDF